MFTRQQHGWTGGCRLKAAIRGQCPDAAGKPANESIKHAHFNEAWVMQGDQH